VIGTKTRLSPADRLGPGDNAPPPGEPRTVAGRTLGRTLFSFRWLLAPFYLGLAISLLVLLIKFGQKTAQLVSKAMPASSSEVITLVLLPHRSSGLRAIVLAAFLLAAFAASDSSLAQRADSNTGLEGGHGALSDAILATPNRKTPVPQDNMFATAPHTTQTAPASRSKTKTIPTPPVMNRTFRGEHQ
jgi:hypothetical protein